MLLPEDDEMSTTEEHVDRFDLEQALAEGWQVADDLKLISQKVLDGELSDEQIANLLAGLAEMHLLRCQHADDIFEQLISEGTIR